MSKDGLEMHDGTKDMVIDEEELYEMMQREALEISWVLCNAKSCDGWLEKQISAGGFKS